MNTTSLPTTIPIINTCHYCWIIGVAVTFVGQIINNFGTNLVKYSHKLYDEKKLKKSWIIFISGWILFVLGISFDFISFAYTAQSILGAVAGVQFISNLVFAYIILKERITKASIWGSGLILAGTILIGIFGDHQSPLVTTENLIKFFESLPFVVWISCLVGTGVLLEISYHVIDFYKKKREQQYEINLSNGDDDEENLLLLFEKTRLTSTKFKKFCEHYLPFVYCFTSSIVGVQTPILGKSLSLLMRDTINGNNQFKTWYPYVLGSIFVVLGLVWVWRYNTAIKRYDILYVMPTITACYITLNILGGGIYFEEFNNFEIYQWVTFSIGIVFIIVGIVLISIHGTHHENYNSLRDYTDDSSSPNTSISPSVSVDNIIAESSDNN